MNGGPFLAQILDLLRQNGALNAHNGNFGPRMNLNRYTGQMLTPDQQMLYKMQMYQPNGYPAQPGFNFNSYNQNFKSDM